MTVWMIEEWQGPVTDQWLPKAFERTRREARIHSRQLRYMWPDERYRIRLYYRLEE